MTDLATVAITKALSGAGYVSVYGDIDGITNKVLRDKRLASMVADTIAGMTDWNLVRIMKNGTLMFARWSPEGECELLATTRFGVGIASARCAPQCLDWFLAAAAAPLWKD